MNGNKVLLGTWAAGIILVGYRSFHNNKGMPTPKSIIGVSVIWSMLSFFALIPQAGKLANVLSVGVIGGLLLTDSSILGGGTPAVPGAPGGNQPQTSGATKSTLGVGTQSVGQINKIAGQTA